MSHPPAGMSADEIDALLREVSHGSIAPRTAISLMKVNGLAAEDAARRVFHALGGSEATKLDDEGRPRYVESGRLVADVERAIAG